jgi:hypothetical protein
MTVLAHLGRKRLEFLISAILLASAIAVLGVTAGPARADVGFDRPGGDYTRFVVRSGDPARCALRCERDTRCRAWAFSYPTTERAEAVCWLKASVPPRVANPCCVSGVRGAGVNAPRASDIEFGIDRPGGDFKSFEVKPDNRGSACAAACKDDNECRAWTYARPGYEGAAARCYLKRRVTPPRREPCCMSGVVR